MKQYAYVFVHIAQDGGWSGYSEWGTCTVSCEGVGVQTRTRSCTNPPQYGDGQPCNGDPTQQRSCDMTAISCPSKFNCFIRKNIILGNLKY